MSSEDADDERETPSETPIHWIDSRRQTFTIFVVLPNEDVCTLRDVPSGISVFDLKGKLELVAGLPSQIYSLMYPDGEEIMDDQRLLVHENIQNGYLLKMQLLENWESLYTAVIKNNMEHMYHSGGVHLKGNIKLQPGDSERIGSVVRERGSVALFLASFLGLQRMVNMLLSVDVDVNVGTHFGRTSLHAAAARDHLTILDLLLKYAASIRQTDCYGLTALDVAKEMSSDLCAKRLRVMLLNLRGMIASGASHVSRSRSGVAEKRCSNANSLPEMPSRSNTVTDMRICSNLPHNSAEGPENHNCNATATNIINKRKPLLSASLTENSHSDNTKANVLNTPVTVLKNQSDSKRLIKWKDAPTGNTYWQVIELDRGEIRNIGKAMDIKPIALLQQTKILKFDKTMKEPAVPPASPVSNISKTDGKSTTGDTIRESIFTKYSGGNSVSPKSVRFSKARPKYFKGASRRVNSSRSMRRKINIAANNSRTDGQKQNSDAFEKWLAKKKEEAERSEEEDEHSELSEDESETEGDRLREFNKWVRKHNRIERRTLTPGNRPAPHIIHVGGNQLDENLKPSPESNIVAHKEYQMRKRSGQKSVRRQTAKDFETEKRQLEERRQRLLLSAISYDEWLDHSEERKQLINRILQANLEEMKKLEEEKFKDRLKFYSYDDWKEKVDKREAEERKRRHIQKKYEQEQNANRFQVSSIAPSFDDWLRSKKPGTHKDRNEGSNKPSRKQEEVDSAYDSWLLRKHKDGMKAINTQIYGEHIQLDNLRQRKTTTVI